MNTNRKYLYAMCEDCGEKVPAEIVDVGVGVVGQYFHCGWSHECAAGDLHVGPGCSERESIGGVDLSTSGRHHAIYTINNDVRVEFMRGTVSEIESQLRKMGATYWEVGGGEK